MDLTFQRFAPSEAETEAAALVDFLTGEPWPFHINTHVSAERARRRVSDGDFDGEYTRSFWILAGDERVGLLILEDVGDGTPMFDLRIGSRHRGRGFGAQAVRWLTEYLFTEFPDLLRVEGNTRQDNVAMRRTFTSCGYVKESHYRDAWPSAADGVARDAVGYAILRRDWLSGTTTAPDWDDEPVRAGS